MSRSKQFKSSSRLYRAMRVPVKREEVFAFFSDVRNLERTALPKLKLQILSPLPVEMKQGATIEFRMTMGCIPYRCRLGIVEWDPPHAFIDEQDFGLYRLWHHAHRFNQLEDGQTEMVDEVRYQLAFHPLSNFALPWVDRQLKRIFDYRETMIRSMLLREEIAHPK